MKPTTEQIAQAKRLKSKGLCQDSKEWIYFNKSEDGSIHFTGDSKGMDILKIGPLPEYEEVTGEIFELLKPDQEFFTYEGGLEISDHKAKPSILIFKSVLPKYDAVIEALFYLSETK